MGATMSSQGGAFPIGELSRATGVNIETIRYYEKVGMLPAPPRTEGGRRVYEGRHKQTLAFIRRGRELGFTLDEIRTLLDLGGPSDAPCADVREIAANHLGDIRAKIADLRKLERLLAATIDRCESGNSPGCPVLEVLGSGPGEGERAQAPGPANAEIRRLVACPRLKVYGATIPESDVKAIGNYLAQTY